LQSASHSQVWRLIQTGTQPGALQACLHSNIVQELHFGAGVVDSPSVLGAAKSCDRSTMGAPWEATAGEGSAVAVGEAAAGTACADAIPASKLMEAPSTKSLNARGISPPIAEKRRFNAAFLYFD